MTTEIKAKRMQKALNQLYSEYCDAGVGQRAPENRSKAKAVARVIEALDGDDDTLARLFDIIQTAGAAVAAKA